MNISIIEDNTKLSTNDKDQIYEKLVKKLEKHLKTFADDIKNATIKVSKNSSTEEYKINFNMWLPGKKHIYAESEEEVFISALAELRNDLERQLKTYKSDLDKI